MRRKWEIELAGLGGQGLAVAGLVLAEAAGIYEGKEVAVTEVHGIAARGGPSRSEIIIGDEEIDFPAVVRPDILVAMTQKDCDIYAPALGEGGVLIVDEAVSELGPSSAGRVYRLPFTRCAREKVGNPIAVNIVILGALAGLTQVVSLEALAKALAARMPGAIEVNRKALDAGAHLALEVTITMGHNS